MSVLIILILVAVVIFLLVDSNHVITTEDVYEECIRNIDDVVFERQYLGINYFSYKSYEIVLWIPGSTTIVDRVSNQRYELDDDLSYELGNLLKSKI